MYIHECAKHACSEGIPFSNNPHCEHLSTVGILGRSGGLSKWVKNGDIQGYYTGYRGY